MEEHDLLFQWKVLDQKWTTQKKVWRPPTQKPAKYHNTKKQWKKKDMFQNRKANSFSNVNL